VVGVMKAVVTIVGVVLLVIGMVAMVNNNNRNFGDTDEVDVPWRERCVHGQLVYLIAYDQKAVAVNALHDDGKPILCGNDNKYRGNDDVPNSNY
jgi:hypothetical protein